MGLILTAGERRATTWKRTISSTMTSDLPLELDFLAQLVRSLPTEMPDFSCWSHQPQLSQQQQPQHSPPIQEPTVYLCPVPRLKDHWLPVVNRYTVTLTSHNLFTFTCYCYC